MIRLRNVGSFPVINVDQVPVGKKQKDGGDEDFVGIDLKKKFALPPLFTVQDYDTKRALEMKGYRFFVPKEYEQTKLSVATHKHNKENVITF